MQEVNRPPTPVTVEIRQLGFLKEKTTIRAEYKEVMPNEHIRHTVKIEN
jgi:hypothetical protein